MPVNTNKLRAALERKRRKREQLAKSQPTPILVTLHSGERIEMSPADFDDAVRTLAGFPTLRTVPDAAKSAHNVSLLRRAKSSHGYGRMLELAAMIVGSEQ